MNIPVATIFLILAISVTLGWRQWETLRELSETERRLAAHTTKESTENRSSAGPRTPGVRQSEAEREGEARSAARQMIASLIEQGTPTPGESYSVMEKRVARLLESFYQMNRLQLRVMIEELRNFPDPKSGHSWYAKSLSEAITALAATDPESAMVFLSKDEGRLGKIMFDSYDRVIGIWALEDPFAALAWTRENPSKVGYEGRKSLLAGLATRDPGLAFQTLMDFQVYHLRGDGEHEGKPDFSAAQIIARTARTLEDRSAMLGILRSIRNSPGEDPENIKGLIVRDSLYAMAGGIGTYAYPRACVWLDSLNLRPDEAVPLFTALQVSEIQPKEDVGKWFEWMGDHLPSEEFQAVAAQKIWEWVRADPQAVEKWLAQAADGPAKRMVNASHDLSGNR